MLNRYKWWHWWYVPGVLSAGPVVMVLMSSNYKAKNTMLGIGSEGFDTQIYSGLIWLVLIWGITGIVMGIRYGIRYLKTKNKK